MKKLVLALATLLMLTATVPSFADGNPQPHGPSGSRCTTSGCTLQA